MKHLKDTNPAHKWLQTRMSTVVTFDNGHKIIVRFFTNTALGSNKINFTPQIVWKRWSKIFLGEDEESLAKHLDIESAFRQAKNVADKINAANHKMALAVMGHFTLSFIILDAIKNKEYKFALQSLIQLANDLMKFENVKDVGWSEWAGNCMDYIEDAWKE